MDRRTKWLAGGTLALAAIGAGTGYVVATEGRDTDQPLAGTDLDKAVAAALAATGGGTVIETEVGDDGAAYGVEVRLANGNQVEVNLDENFAVIGQEADDDGAGDEEGSESD